MREMSVKEIKLAVGGEWFRRPSDGSASSESQRAAVSIARGISTDTRTLVEGDVFVALTGANFDGAQFLASAQAKGAIALVTQRLPEGFVPRVPTILVEDSLVALGRLATANLTALKACVVAVGGSNGKTTTRELTFAVLARRFAAIQNHANENNLVGVPLTLLRAGDRHDFVVAELGTNQKGEVARLAAIARPRCAILTSISEEHLEGLGSLEGVLDEEAALLEALPPDGIAIVNFDDVRCVRAAARANCRVVSFGTDERCEIRAGDIRMDREGTHFVVNDRYAFQLPLLGRHNVNNALAAIATGWVCGVSMQEMQSALRDVEPAPHRLEYRQFGGIGVIDDSYNANPASMCAALRTLAAFPCRGQRVAVLGDMLELGAHSERLHREVGAFATTLAPDLVITVGAHANLIADALEEHFEQAGRGAVWRCKDAPDAAAELLRELQEGDVVLLKGSHGVNLSRVTQALRLRFAVAVQARAMRPTVRELPVGDELPHNLASF